MSDQENKFENEKVSIIVEKKKNCVVELQVTTSKELVEDGYKKAIKEVSKEVEIPGFRKGKAPTDIILKKFKPQVEEQFKRKIADIAFIEAEKLCKLPILSNSSRISFDLKEYSKEDGAKLKFSFEIEPTIPSVDPKNFKLEAITKKEITKDDVAEHVRQMQFFYATWEEIKDRPIEENDFVILDLESMKNPEKPEKVFADTRFEMTNKSLAAWMKKILLGAKTGESVEGTSYPDDNMPDSEKNQFEPQNVRITIKKIEKPTLPELNEEFAKKVGVATIDDMNKSVEEMLTQKAKQKFENDKRDLANKFLVEKYQFDLPLTLVEQEKAHRKNSILQDPAAKKRWDAIPEDEKGKLEKRFLIESINAIKLFYLAKKIVEDHKIPITNQEITNEAEERLRIYGAKEGSPKLSKEDMAAAASTLLLEKAQDFVLNAGIIIAKPNNLEVDSSGTDSSDTEKK